MQNRFGRRRRQVLGSPPCHRKEEAAFRFTVAHPPAKAEPIPTIKAALGGPATQSNLGIIAPSSRPRGWQNEPNFRPASQHPRRFACGGLCESTKSRHREADQVQPEYVESQGAFAARFARKMSPRLAIASP